MVFIAAGEKARREQRVSLEEEDQDEWKLYRSCGSEFLGLSRLVLTVSSLFCKGLGSPCYIFQLCSYTMKAATVSSVAQLCPTLCDPMNCSTPGLPVHHQLPEFTQTHVHRVGDTIQPSHPLSSPSPPAFIFPSIRAFSNELALRIRWPKYWSFSFNITPYNEHSGLISFRMDLLDLLAVQRTLKSLLQHHSSKASILLHSAISVVLLSHPYMTTGKTIALTI